MCMQGKFRQGKMRRGYDIAEKRVHGRYICVGT